jgi:hypothetical protein
LQEKVSPAFVVAVLQMGNQAIVRCTKVHLESRKAVTIRVSSSH